MEPITITLASLLIGKVLDEMAYRYGGSKYPKIKKYTGTLSIIAKLWTGRK